MFEDLHTHKKKKQQKSSQINPKCENMVSFLIHRDKMFTPEQLGSPNK